MVKYESVATIYLSPSMSMKARAYFQAEKNNLHPMGCSWYIVIGDGTPFGPFNDYIVAYAAVTAINEALINAPVLSGPDETNQKTVIGSKSKYPW